MRLPLGKTDAVLLSLLLITLALAISTTRTAPTAWTVEADGVCVSFGYDAKSPRYADCIARAIRYAENLPTGLDDLLAVKRDCDRRGIRIVSYRFGECLEQIPHRLRTPLR